MNGRPGSGKHAEEFLRVWALAGFAFRFRVLGLTASFCRKSLLRFLGLKIGKDVFMPRINITWPHQVRIGNRCRIEPGVTFKVDGPYRKERVIDIGDDVFLGRSVEFNIQHGIRVGADSLIASSCILVDHDHGLEKGKLVRHGQGVGAPIEIGADVWIGTNVVVLRGVKIGDAAVIGAGSVVTRNVPSNEIWAGVPAKKISTRPN